jgi:hypothetical protein
MRLGNPEREARSGVSYYEERTIARGVAKGIQNLD